MELREVWLDECTVELRNESFVADNKSLDELCADLRAAILRQKQVEKEQNDEFAWARSYLPLF